jgi:hypothetical protein
MTLLQAPGKTIYLAETIMKPLFLQSTIPYGPAPAWCFPTFEGCMYLLFLFCLATAVRRGKKDVFYLLGALAFGLVLEYIEVISDMGYTYGHFMVMLGRAPHDIPLCIGVGWGIIIYTARLFSDGLGLPLWAAAAFDALLAINIDLSMDTVAYRLHMWTWNWAGTKLNPLTAQWFGIPWGNFFGWQVVVFFYSGFSRCFERVLCRTNGSGAWRWLATALLALLCAQVLLYTLEAYVEEFMYKNLGITSLGRFLGFLTLQIGLAAWGWSKRTAPPALIPVISWVVPGWFHLFFFTCLFLAGFYRENSWMLIAACINLLIGIVIHWYPAVERKPTNLPG